MCSHINVGFGEDISILEVAELIARTVGYRGAIITDPEKPDGTPRKLMDSSKLRSLGWSPTTPLREGLALAYEDFRKSSRK
jgi:GDP-L-fucose synthase